MNIVIRVDASEDIGTGHVMRCMTLADELRQRDAEVCFICRQLPLNISESIERKGYKVYRGPFATGQENTAHQHTPHSHWLGVNWERDVQETKEIVSSIRNKIDWLVVDHYALEKSWEASMRDCIGKIMVIDDLADRPHDCELLLDQNLYERIENHYGRLVPMRCRKLLGPTYALLRPEFREARKYLRKRDGSVKRILVFFGGVDQTNETAKALRAMRMLNRRDIEVDVVVGTVNPHRAQIQAVCAGMPNGTCHFNVSNVAELMAHADLAIGAGGTTTWERCCMGLPSLIVALADNQNSIARSSELNGIAIYLGRSRDVTSNYIHTVLQELMHDKERLLNIEAKCSSVVDAKGTERVIQVLEEIHTKVAK